MQRRNPLRLLRCHVGIRRSIGEKPESTRYQVGFGAERFQRDNAQERPRSNGSFKHVYRGAAPHDGQLGVAKEARLLASGGGPNR